MQKERIRSIRILSDGKAGDEQPCLGVAEALGVVPDIRRVTPSWWYSLWMPWGGIDPAHAPSGQKEGPLAPPYPDLVIASGRRCVPYIRFLRYMKLAPRQSRPMTVFLKDPRIGAHVSDFIWVFEHDRLRDLNVMHTLTGPHRHSVERLKKVREELPDEIRKLPHPRVAVLVGGNSRHHRFTRKNAQEFLEKLACLQKQPASLLITASRRTPDFLRIGLQGLVRAQGDYFWDGQGANPYTAFLAAAHACVVTGDSVNMVGEAAVTGRPVYVFLPEGGHPKINYFLKRIEAEGITRPLSGTLDTYTYPAIDATKEIAKAIEFYYKRLRGS